MLPLQVTTARSLMLLLAAFTTWEAQAQPTQPVGAQEVPPASELRIAAERFDQGRDAYKAGAFAEAAEHFEAADRRAPSASALGLAMRSRDEAGQLLRAANLAELILVRYPEDTELADRAREIVAVAATGSAKVHVTCEPACDMVVDRRLSHGGVQPNWVIYLEPGEHVLSANFSGSGVVSKEVSVEVGKESSYAFDAPKPVAPKSVSVPPPTPPPLKIQPQVVARHGLAPTWFWIGVGTTAVLSGASIWSGVDAQNNPGPDAVRRECVGLGESCVLYQQGQRNELRTNILIGATAVSAAATIAIGAFFTDFSRGTSLRASHGTSAGLRPWLFISASARDARSVDRVPQGALFGAEGRF